MPIPLPIPAWFVTLTPECGYDNSPLGRDFNRFDLGLQEEPFPELYVKREFDEARLDGDPGVVSYQAVWYICPLNFTNPAAEIEGVDAGDYFRERLQGRFVSNCFGRARIYPQRNEALADLAKCDLGVGYVWGIARSRQGEGKQLAQAVLDGELDSLPVLADKLADEGHPLAEKVRELCTPARKRGKKKK